MLQDLFIFSPIELILAGIITVLFIILVLYFLITYARPLRAAKKAAKEGVVIGDKDLKPVSVIVYARGDAEDLKKNLPVLLTQEYPEYEVIVVNDGSDADSEDVLKILSSEYKHLYYTYVPVDTQYLSHKKLALTMGIKAAKHEILLFTEADCTPVSPQWIQAMTAHYTPETTIRLGFCTYRFHKGFLNKLIAYDNLVNGLQYLSAALAHRPFTGNGRNLSYRRELFFARKGYSKSLNLHAGADDLFINEVATRTNTQAEFSTNSLMEMAEINDYNSWREIKVSRAVTQHFYKGASLAFYRLETFSYALFQLTAIASIIAGIFGNWMLSAFAGILFILRFVVKAVIFRRSALLLRQKSSTGALFFLEAVLPLYNLYIRIYRIFRGKNDYTSRL